MGNRIAATAIAAALLVTLAAAGIVATGVVRLPTVSRPSPPPKQYAVAVMESGLVTVHDPTAGELRRFAVGETFDNTHVWSPDGRFLVYRVGGQEESALVVQRADGSARWVLPKLSSHPRMPAWSPDSRRIVFVDAPADRPRGSGLHLGIVNADGTGLRAVGTFGKTLESPAWSPDGVRMLFTVSGSQIYVGPSDGEGAVDITGRDPMDLGAAWSPAGTHIVACSLHVDFKTNGLVAISRDGKERIVLHPQLCGLHGWSPDGKRIAVSEGIPKNLVAIVPLERPLPPVVFDENVVGGGPDVPVWSPDGRWVAIGISAQAAADKIKRSTILIRADGSEIRRIEAGGDPQWIPVEG